MNKNIKVSVVTVCFNVVKDIERTMLSVINQTYPNIEYIVIDGGSTDGTVNVIKKHENQIFKWISEPDKGIYDAMNKGIKFATGEWIIFMNVGDVFYDSYVISNMQFDKYESDKNVRCVYGDYISLHKIKTVEVRCENPFYSRTDYLKNPSMGFHHQSTFVRTSTAKRLLFDASHYKLCADYNMIYQIYNEGGLFERIPLFVAIVNDREGASAENRLLQLREHYEILGLSENKYAKRKISLLRFNEKLKKWLGYDFFVELLLLFIRK